MSPRTIEFCAMVVMEVNRIFVSILAEYIFQRRIGIKFTFQTVDTIIVLKASIKKFITMLFHQLILIKRSQAFEQLALHQDEIKMPKNTRAQKVVKKS